MTKRAHLLQSEASMAELDRLWADEDLTMRGIAQEWSKFHNHRIGEGTLRHFARHHRERYPDRRRLNGGYVGDSGDGWRQGRRRYAACDLWGAAALVKQGRAVEDAAAIARVPVAALRRFFN